MQFGSIPKCLKKLLQKNYFVSCSLDRKGYCSALQFRRNTSGVEFHGAHFRCCTVKTKINKHYANRTFTFFSVNAILNR